MRLLATSSELDGFGFTLGLVLQVDSARDGSRETSSVLSSPFWPRKRLGSR